MDHCENPSGPVVGLVLALPLSLAIWSILALAIMSVA